MKTLTNKISPIIVSLLIIFSASLAHAQKTDQYGATDANYGKFQKDKEVSVSGTQLDQDGFQISKSKQQKKFIKKQKKYSLTSKERELKLRSENGEDLSFWEKRTLNKIKKKEDKKKEFLNKYKPDTTNSNGSIDTTASKLSLSITEKNIIAKKDTAQKLTFAEKIEYRKAIRRQKQIEKRNYKDSIKLANSFITPEEQNILDLKDSDSTLTKDEKKIYKNAKKKKKKADKVEAKRKKDKLKKQGWTAQRVTGFRLRYLLPAPKSQKAKDKARKREQRRHMTKEQKKIERLKKKYALSDKEKDAYNKGSSGVPLSYSDKKRYKRAVWKEWKYKEKVKKVYLKALEDRQSKNTKKMMKKSKKKTKRENKKLMKKRKKGQFWKKFKKKKQYGTSNKRG